MLFLLLALLAFASFSLALPQVTGTPNSPPSSTISPRPAVPTKNCISDNFVKPWVIDNLVVTAPIDTALLGPGYISFAFCDPNEELQLTTTCTGTAQNGTAKLANGGYLACEDEAIRFQLTDMSTLLISRWYKDPCKGTPPYDTGIAYGQQDASFQVISSAAGAVHFQQEMQMNVTRMA